DEIEEHVMMNSQQPMSGFISPEEITTHSLEEMESEQPENPHVQAEPSSTLTKDQLLKLLSNCDPGRMGQLFGEVIKEAITGQSSRAAPVTQTMFQGSSSKGKAPVSALKFRAPTASAPPPLNAVKEAAPSMHYTAPSAPDAHHAAFPSHNMSYAD